MSMNKKGFTLVEILAAIVILGVLMSVAIVSVSRILSNSKEGFYDNLEDQLILAAKSYYSDHRTLLSQSVGQTRKVTIETLIKNNYLKRGDVVDYGKSECDTNASYVQVIKSSKKNFIYTVYLKCPAHTIDHHEDIESELTVKVTLTEASPIENSKANIVVSVNSLSAIGSYQYSIYKNGQIIYTSDSISGSGVEGEGINKSISLKKYVPGAIKVVATAYDIYGNVKSDSASLSIYDKGLPSCGNQSPSLDLKDNGDWLNAANSTASRKISIRCVDSKTKCLSPSFSRTFTSDVDESYVTILGKNNEEINCPVTVMIDKTKPVCGTKSESTTWTNGTRNVSVKCGDATSGCVQASYSETFNDTNSKGKEIKTKDITIKDKAGNSNSCAVNVYVDKKPPTCGTHNGSSTSWTASDRTITTGCNDSGSGCVTQNPVTYNTTTKTKDVVIRDNAGNSTTCSVNVYVDKTNPTCTISKSTNSKVPSLTLTVNGSDSGSGVNSYSWSSSSSGFSSTTTKTITANGTYTAYVKDNVGHVGSCSIKVDNIQATYKIIYHLNGGTNNPSNPSEYKVGQTTTLYNPSRSNYSFAGWYTNSSLTNEITSISSSQQGDIDVYAKWQALAPSCNGVSGNTGASWVGSRTVTVGCKNPDGSACSSVNGTYTSNGSKSLKITGSNGATATCSFTVSKIDSGTPSVSYAGSAGLTQCPSGSAYSWLDHRYIFNITNTASGFRASGSKMTVSISGVGSGTYNYGSARVSSGREFGCAAWSTSQYWFARSTKPSITATACNNAGRCGSRSA